MSQQEAFVFIFPTSFAQARLWFLDQLAPGNPFYNVSTALRLTGFLNLTALEQTFNDLVRRHETLRTTFVMVEGQPLQAIAPELTIPLPVIDLRSLSTAEREIQARRLATQEAQRPVNLSTGPLLQVTLLQLDEAEYVLLLNLHHIVADAWSIGVLIRELGLLYTSTPLPELPIQYADFAEWQREWLQTQVETLPATSLLQTQLAYWQKQLDGISVLNLPTDRIRTAVPSYKGAKQFLELSQSLTQALEALSQLEGITLFMTLLAAFQTLLYRYTQQDDIAVGSPIANRNRRELEGLIGFFVNSLVLRTNLSGNPTFRELLARVREVTLGAYAHQDLPFEKLVEELHPERSLSYHPLFQVAIALQNTPVEVFELPELTLSLFEFDNKTAKLDLEFHLWQDCESLKGQMVYSTDLFDDTTITRMLGHFQTLLESIVANPEQHLSDLQILTSKERHQLLVFNQNQSKIATADTRGYTQIEQKTIRVHLRPSAVQNPKSKIEQCFHQLFEAQVEQTPDAIAVLTRNFASLTYRELNIRANQLAHHLQQLGVVPEVLVGICLERSLEMIVGLLAILKAGGAYLPLDPILPQERLNFMLEDAQVSILLTHSLLAPSFPGSAWECKGGWGDLHRDISVVYIDDYWEAIAQHSQENPISNVTFNNLAYVIYTSGSTGKPKGVLIEHRGLSNLAQAQIETFNLQPNNRVLQFASLSFDASIFEIVMALGTGGTLCLANKESLLPGKPLIDLLQKQAITHVTLPPAVISVLPPAELPALQTIICAGESCSLEIVKRWWLDSRRFFNAYGLTEATVWSTIADITPNGEKPLIGRAIANTQIYILDRHLQLVPIGIVGELYIGGDGLARGYLNRPELTQTQFLEEIRETRFLQETGFLRGKRLYKTGDLARYRPDGNIEFLGRSDNQVKIRGFRIELQEIETVLNQHQGVLETVVIALEDQRDRRLVAYIVPTVLTQNFVQTRLIASVRQFLKEKLPEYMIPSAFVVLDSLPLTQAGKVDRGAIPTGQISITTDTFVAPRTSTESKLAKIWAEVLNLEQLGIHDNFFELGGNSLLSVHLLEQINKQFERELPLSTLFLNPTIESLANCLLLGIDSLPWTPLVAIQPTGSNPPFFCVHPIFGVVFPYYELAHHLGKNQPFYGLQPIGVDGKASPLTRIEDMAAKYIEALQLVQPKGPYFLGGWSFGGLVAFEMAQQLQKAGDEVALLALLDTIAPVAGNLPSIGDSFKFLFTTVARYIWPFLLDYVYLIMRQESKSRILRELTIRPMLRVFQANSQATLNYVPQVYPKRITLLRTSVQSKIGERDPSLGWGKLALEGVEIHSLAGNHLTMLKKPHVQVLAEQLRACIKKVQSE